MFGLIFLGLIIVVGGFFQIRQWLGLGQPGDEEKVKELYEKNKSRSILERELEYSRDIIAFKNALRGNDPGKYEDLFGNKK